MPNDSRNPLSYEERENWLFLYYVPSRNHDGRVTEADRQSYHEFLAKISSSTRVLVVLGPYDAMDMALDIAEAVTERAPAERYYHVTEYTPYMSAIASGYESMGFERGGEFLQGKPHDIEPAM